MRCHRRDAHIFPSWKNATHFALALALHGSTRASDALLTARYEALRAFARLRAARTARYEGATPIGQIYNDGIEPSGIRVVDIDGQSRPNPELSITAPPIMKITIAPITAATKTIVGTPLLCGIVPKSG